MAFLGWCLFVLIGVSSVLSGQFPNQHQAIPPIKMAALTIDDGPSLKFVEETCRVLQRHRVSATFFCIGENLQRDPQIARIIHHYGCEIGNHSWSHRNCIRIGNLATINEIKSTSGLIRKITGSNPHFFRPPYGANNSQLEAVVHHLGLEIAMWTIDPKDWRGQYGPSPSDTCHYVLGKLRPNAIILLHEKRNTFKLLPGLIEAIQRKGYRIVSLEELNGFKRPSMSESKHQPRWPRILLALAATMYFK